MEEELALGARAGSPRVSIVFVQIWKRDGSKKDRKQREREREMERRERERRKEGRPVQALIAAGKKDGYTFVRSFVRSFFLSFLSWPLAKDNG